jgi:hypothetical protein
MSTYIRSKATNSTEDITFQLGTSTTRLRPSGEFNKIVGIALPVEPWDGATKGYVDTKISDLVGGAPELLDTLNEIAQAINDDANFGNAVISQLSNKLDLSGGTLTGTLILNNSPVVAMGAATKEYVDNATNSVAVSSTDDVPEGSRLYYTSARANSDFDASLATKLTSNLAEGTNLYYTDARFDNRLATKSTTNLNEGSNLYYTDARARDAISVTGSLSYDSEQGIISYTAPVANINSLSDVDTTTRIPVVGEALVWDGSNWVPGASVTAVLADASLDGGSFD